MLSVAGPWLLNKLYSFTKLMRTAGLLLRIVREVRGLLKSPGSVVIRHRTPPRKSANLVRR